MTLVGLAHKLLLLDYHIRIALGYIKLCGARSVDAPSNAGDKTVPERNLSLYDIVTHTRQMILQLVVLDYQTTNEMMVALTGYMNQRLIVADITYSHLVAVTRGHQK